MGNRLESETSPYLLQHASNPIDWYPWGDEAWHRAVAEDKPVFVSIGYASCHWCHVMERESFSDPDIAAALNRNFIAIKVDREERPDLDTLYIEALQTLTGDAGWPLSLFLTPERKLFFGGTYFPPKAQDDLPSFSSVIESVAEEWARNRREIEKQAQSILQHMRDREKTLPAARPLSRDLLDQGIVRIMSTADQTNGGFGETPKFPQPWLVELMLRAASRGPGGAHGIADLTLRRMARGGIYDQLGGGFHRYAADAAWKVPHFEKMLYDNALLGRVYLHAWQGRGDPLFRRIATETFDYLLASLRAPGGAFCAGQDSDTHGVEGGYYCWTHDEVAAVAPAAAAYYGVTPGGNFKGTNVLSAGRGDPPVGAREALLAARAERPAPERDAKVLTSWNGLAIGALAEGGLAFDRPDFLGAAVGAAEFLLGHVMAGGALAHAWQGDAPKGIGLAEDYVHLADGLFTLWEATGHPRWIEACEQLARRLLATFWDPDDFGLFSTPEDGEDLILARRDFIDGTIPSPNGAASLLFQRLGVLLGAQDLTQRGREILEAAEPVMQAIPQECGTLFAALDFWLSTPREIAVIGAAESPATRALLREVWTRHIPNRVLATSPPGIASPLLDGRSELDGRPTAYVCDANTCKRPTPDPQELARQLHAPGLPLPEQVNRATELARSTLHRISLFDRLDNPLWIDPLWDRGFFQSPPGLIEEYIPGGSGSPPWPDSKYLARMAVMDPFAVHRVAMAMPDTENSLVHEDLIDAALAMPADLAADFAERAKGWLRATPGHVMLPKKLGALMANLAKGGYAAEALALAVALLELLPDAPPEIRGAASEEGFIPAPQPRARFGPWDYQEILEEDVPALVRAAPGPALKLLSDLLASALEMSRTQDDAGPGPVDASYLWRPSIGDDARNLDRTLRNPLVSALRDAAEAVARENPLMLPDLISALQARGWPVFRRIALHLLRSFPTDAPELAAAALADRDLLTDPNLSREYLLLARQQFAGLTGEQQAQILGWVAAGPALARWDGVPDRWAADPADAVAAAGYVRDWSASRAAFLSSALQPGATGEDRELQDAAFAFRLKDPPVDLTTPKQAEWLRSADVAEVARFLSQWRPPGGEQALVGAPTPAGLQKKLVEVVTSEPARFADNAPALSGLPADYLRAVVAGLREAARQGTTFAWGPVIELFAFALARPVTMGGEDAELATASARALQISIARCLGVGLNAGPTEIPFPEREAVWAIIRPIAETPEIAPDPASVQPPELGRWSRSVAAEGLQAVARYALWVRRHTESQPGGRERALRGFQEMPEVREALETHVGARGTRAPTIEVQAVYGQWYPWFVMLDPEWATLHRDAIFPTEAAHEHLRKAAWETYLGRTPVFDQVFHLLSNQYGETAAMLADAGSGPGEAVPGLTRPQQGFAEHLITLYLRGRIPLEDGNSLLASFFEQAPEAQRAHALAYVGQMIHAQQGRIPAEIIDRLQRLWEARLAAARAAGDLSGRAEELTMFGAWFAADKFPADWGVRQLADLLSLTGRVASTSKVVERLKTYMDTMPYEVAQCLAALVASERGAITILGWGQDAQQILSRIVGSPDPRARSIALDLLDTFDLQPVDELIRRSLASR